MAVFRVERTHDYTVMSNYHLRDRSLSLKAKGLLSQMLSLPEDWDYTLAGLSKINRESRDAVRTAVKELEQAGYLVRRQTTDASGKFSVNEYIIREKPEGAEQEPLLDEPLPENPTAEITLPENTTQLNTNRQNTKKQNTDLSSTESLLFSSGDAGKPVFEAKRKERISAESIKKYRRLIMQNIGYELLRERFGSRADDLDEIVELMTETVCTTREYIRVAGGEFPQDMVRERFLNLNSEHIVFVMHCMKENTTKIRNMKQYLLTVLFNAPATISNYYSSLISSDLYMD